MPAVVFFLLFFLAVSCAVLLSPSDGLIPPLLMCLTSYIQTCLRIWCSVQSYKVKTKSIKITAAKRGKIYSLFKTELNYYFSFTSCHDQVPCVKMTSNKSSVCSVELCCLCSVKHLFETAKYTENLGKASTPQDPWTCPACGFWHQDIGSRSFKSCKLRDGAYMDQMCWSSKSHRC